MNGYFPELVSEIAKQAKKEHRKFLFIKLNRDPVEKWANIMRRDSDGMKSVGCDKNHWHEPQCVNRKAYIDPKQFIGFVRGDTQTNALIDAQIANITNENPQTFQVETYDFHELLACQGIPQHINRNFGNDVNGCNSDSTYLQDHPHTLLKDVITNFEEFKKAVQGTEWEKGFEADKPIFAKFDPAWDVF